MAIHMMPEIFLSTMVLDGIFEQFPRLRGGCIEQGAMWIVPWLRRLDISQEKEGLPGLVGGMEEKGAQHKTKGVLDAAGDKLREFTDGQNGERERTGRRSRREGD